MNINEATITRIRTLSKAQRLSMYELAYKTGMPPSSITSLEMPMASKIWAPW